MRSIPIENGEVSLVRSLVPIGTESYLVFKNSGRYLNVHTNDANLLGKLEKATRRH